APGAVVHRPLAPSAVRRAWHLADLDVLARAAVTDAVPMPAVIVAERRKAQHTGEKIAGERQVLLPHTHRMQAAHLMLDRYGTVVPRSEVARVRCFHECDLEPVRVDERERAITAPFLGGERRQSVLLQPIGPICEAARRNCQRDLDAEPRALASG